MEDSVRVVLRIPISKELSMLDQIETRLQQLLLIERHFHLSPAKHKLIKTFKNKIDDLFNVLAEGEEPNITFLFSAIDNFVEKQ